MLESFSLNSLKCFILDSRSNRFAPAINESGQWSIHNRKQPYSQCVCKLTSIGVHVCSNMQGRRALCPDPVGSGYRCLRACFLPPQRPSRCHYPRDTRKEKISWNPFHTNDWRHYLLGCKARREVEILKIASIRFLFIALWATLFRVLSAAEWEATARSTAEPLLSYTIQISWIRSPTDRCDSNQLGVFTYWR
jgi:hypothetical protein